MPAPVRIGFLAFPRLTQLDLTGPYEILARIPGADPVLLWKEAGPVRTELGLELVATARLDAAPALDVLVVPGGPGVNAVLADEEVLRFVAARGAAARFATSVCTGALVLGAAGLLRGRRATTHWLSLDLLPLLGATPVAERVVRDGNVVTGGGVTAGVDFGLALAAALAGEAVARDIALLVEYDPAPPYPGSPRTADPATVAALRGARGPLQEERRSLCERAAARLGIR